MDQAEYFQGRGNFLCTLKHRTCREAVLNRVPLAYEFSALSTAPHPLLARMEKKTEQCFQFDPRHCRSSNAFVDTPSAFYCIMLNLRFASARTVEVQTLSWTRRLRSTARRWISAPPRHALAPAQKFLQMGNYVSRSRFLPWGCAMSQCPCASVLMPSSQI